MIALPLLLAWSLPALPSRESLPIPPSNGSRFPASPLDFVPTTVDAAHNPPPWITHIQGADLDGDGVQELLACDARWNRILHYERQPDDSWRETVLAKELIAPAHCTVVDLDQDGDRDLVVSLLGSIWPNDEKLGRLVWLERTATEYVPHVLLKDVRRVADAQPADFDQDGDLDLAVAVFGYARGEILWLEQHPGRVFESHLVMTAAGTIHVPVADYDRDGDPDFAACVSQDDEEVWGFENDGHGAFTRHRLFGSLNDDLGSAGLVLTDLDRDGDDDLLLPVGDNLEDIHSYPQPYHGCFWLENLGNWNFSARRIAQLGGTYAAAPGDFDGDGDIDVTLASMFNDWDREGHASLVWLENDGRQQFTTWQIAAEPRYLVTVAAPDLNADGRAEIVAGQMQLTGPFRSPAGITLWRGPGMPRAGTPEPEAPGPGEPRP